MDISVIKYARPGSIRLVDESGVQIGIVSIRDALNMATERGYDLIEVAPTAKPPVCRLGDYGKLKYEASKKAKPAKSTPRKEVQMSPRIADGDLMTKVNRAVEFLEKGCEVIANVQMRGREKANPEVALLMMNKFVSLIKERVSDVRMLREVTNTGGGKIECLMAK
jgi:translation initiation factor IF-3